jgi:UDP-GlcNAc:undecaprenyl-phosphate/decaprenyl-phosphate GlcNAc-1-phosphate transferase
MPIAIPDRSSLMWLLVGTIVTVLVCANAYPIGRRLSVLAHPDECRKLHRFATPQVGGIAILVGLLVSTAGMLLSGGFSDLNLVHALLVGGIGVGVLGFADDQSAISPLARILLLLVFLGAAFAIDREFISLRLNWSSFEPTSIPVWAYVPLMAVTTVGVVNAVNMADGQDGVVGSMFAVWAACLAIVTNGASAAIAAILCVLSLVFLVFNLRGRIFLGDCGSYGVTFLLGLLVTLAHARGQLSLETVIVWFFIPVADCLRLVISRPLRGLSPYRGDRDHFHHRLEDKMGKRKGLACYVSAVAVSSLVATVEPRLALVCLCLLSAFYFSFAWLTDPNILSIQSDDPETVRVPDLRNVVSISGEALRDDRRQRVAR